MDEQYADVAVELAAVVEIVVAGERVVQMPFVPVLFL